MTGIVIVCLSFSPLFIVMFYCVFNFKRLEEPKFKRTFGSIYEGLKTYRYSSMAFNIIFVLRRFLFAMTCLYLEDYLFLQMIISIYATTFSGCYLLHFVPFEEPLQHRLEVFNEVTTILLYSTAYTQAELPRNYENPENAER